MNAVRTWWLFCLLAALAGCASLITGQPDVKPQGVGQASVSAYATISKTYVVIKHLASTGAVDKATLQRTKNAADEARPAIEAAHVALNAGDLDTALGRLQFAQSLLTVLSAFLAAHGG